MHDPPSGAGDEERAWMGHKRPKHQCPSPTRDSGEIGSAGTSPSFSDGHVAPDHEGPSTEIARARDMDTDTVAQPDELAENDIISDEEFLGYLKVLATRPAPMTAPLRAVWTRKSNASSMSALFSTLAQGVCINDLNDVTLTKEYSSDNLKALLDDYEKDDAVDWYFYRNYSLLADLGDYHRLVLRDDGIRYFDWVTYRSSFTSYKIDEEYVKLCEEISKKIKWIKRYMDCEPTSSEWIEMNNRGFRQAVRIAAGFPRMSYFFALMAFKFDTCVEDIPSDATEDGARELIAWTVWNKLDKPKMWHQYIVRKMEIAKQIGLDSQA